ncbi:hypothetical protein ACKWTF_015009 [Chironomus riparius]
MLRSKTFLCCLSLKVGGYIIAFINLVGIASGCAYAVKQFSYLHNELFTISILILIGIVALFWTLMNIFFISSVRKLDPHGVVDYLNIMLMITVFAFVVNLVEIGYVIRQLYRNRTIIFPWDVLIIPPMVFIIQFYFTIIIESLYRKCEDKGEDDRERVSIVPVEIRGYENQVMKRQIEANGRVLLETDV